MEETNDQLDLNHTQEVYDDNVFVSTIVALGSHSDSQNDPQHLETTSDLGQDQLDGNYDNERPVRVFQDHEITVDADGTFVLMGPIVQEMDEQNQYPAVNHQLDVTTQIQPQPRCNILEESVREVFYGYEDDGQYEIPDGDDNDPSYDPADDEDDDEYFVSRRRSKRARSKSGSSRKKLNDDETSQESNYSRSSSSNSQSKVDPFDKSIRIPLPGSFNSPYFAPYDPNSGQFVRKRNERERARVRSVNEGFEHLRSHLPPDPAPEGEPRDRRLSKVETLRKAIDHIKYLQAILAEDQ